MTSPLALAVLFPFLAAAASGDDTPWLLPGHLVGKNGAVRRVWLVSATAASVRYCRTPASPEITEDRLSGSLSVRLDESSELADARDLYQARKYGEARLKFIEVKERFRPLAVLKNNPSTLAAFYESECLRKSGDLDGLAAARAGFSQASLSRESQLRQLDLDNLWEAVRVKDWERVETLAGKWGKTRLPGDQRVQVAYCLGVALEALKRPGEALFSYDVALTADAGASEEIARPAALRILAILRADEEVRQALRLRGKKEEDKASAGAIKLAEAAGVARLFQLSFGAGHPLPPEFAEFLKKAPER